MTGEVGGGGEPSKPAQLSGIFIAKRSASHWEKVDISALKQWQEARGNPGGVVERKLQASPSRCRSSERLVLSSTLEEREREREANSCLKAENSPEIVLFPFT